ncbi:MAG: TIGR04211 family SH3 domain-containing protein [Gammaproteobacteria bacterium]|nr:TIGR04211 family SH3 domain-containing protein [Gammaproteobacteria bacterium]
MNTTHRQITAFRKTLLIAGTTLMLLPGIYTSASAQEQLRDKMYITDLFEVTMRSGTSTANSIVKILKSGDSLQVLEEDIASQYSLVEADDGKSGYVLSRFLDDMPSARERLVRSSQTNQDQKQVITELGEQISLLQSKLSSAQTDNESLKNTLIASEDELEEVRHAAENTLRILDDNEHLQAIVTELRREKQNLADENDSLKDSTKMDWFIRGATVALVAFLLGIIVTRIRWGKKDSWGSY